jgi:HSP20 family protein
MNVLTRRLSNDPFFGMINEFFGDTESCNGSSVCAPAAGRELSSPLPIDISETDTHLIVRANVPGFTRDQIDAEIHDDVLTIKAERKEEKEETGERYFRRELRTGTMMRRVKLPVAVSDSDIAAELKDGVLTLKVAKPVESTPRKIKIG